MPGNVAASSSEYKIFETEEFKKALARIRSARFLRRKLDEYVYPQLRIEPHFGPNIRKLRDYSPPTWRYRIASFRLFCAIDEDEKIVMLLTIDDRKDAYR